MFRQRIELLSRLIQDAGVGAVSHGRQGIALGRHGLQPVDERCAQFGKGILQVAGAAFSAEGDNPEAIGAGLRALLQYSADHELYARLAFFELPTAGPVALDQADRILDGFTAFLHPGIVPHELARPLGDATLQAIASGIWESIQYEIFHGRRESLPQLAPQITWVALAPFND